MDFQKEKEFIENKFKNIKLISIDENNFATCLCSEHGEFKKRIYDFKKSKLGCPKCSNEEKSKNSKMSVKNFIEAAKKIHGDKYDYSLIKEPISNNDKIKIICPIHGVFEKRVKSHLLGVGCPKCRTKKQELTTEKIIENCKSIYGDKYNFSLVEANASYKIKIICPIHGVFETNYFDFIKGHACPKCSIENIRLREEKKFKEKMNFLNGDKIIYPENFYYLNSYTKVNIIFDGKLIVRDPHTLMKKKLLTEEDKIDNIKIRGINKSLNRWSNIEEELKEKNQEIKEFKKEQIDFIKNGKANKNFLIDIKCKKHGWVKQNFYELRNGYGCPRCFYKKISIAEKEICDFIKSIYSKSVVENDRTILNGKELDIYIPELKLAIEYDGLYWHNNVNNYYKYKLCLAKGIRLIQITEWEWKNENNKIKSFLGSLFKKDFIKIGARKCYVKEISLSEYKDFCNKYHLQGYSHSSVKLGLFYKDELVEIEGLSKARFGNYDWELIRECSKTDYFIYGGKSKLLKYFEEKYKPKNLVSYCEKNKFSGKSYLACGFKLLKESHRGYSYYKNNKKFSRMNFQKHKLENKLENFNKNLTEFENMKNNGYLKLFDYGNFVFIKEFSR